MANLEYAKNWAKWDMLLDAATKTAIAAKINEAALFVKDGGQVPADSVFPTGTVLSASQTGNGDSTNVFSFASPSYKVREGALIHLSVVAGATPTCTYALMGSTDGVSYSALSYADSLTPTNFVTTTFVLTASGSSVKIIKPGQKWKYFKLTYSANTNMTNSADILPLGD